MPCFRPLHGWKARRRNPETGRRSITFNRKDGFEDMPVTVPCGQCIGCRLEKSRQWAMRCVHEAQLYEDNCFLTLTYRDEDLPHDGSLNHEHFAGFMKRLRKSLEVDGKTLEQRKIRYYMCGEYGDQFSRPHYHACVFNWRPDDLVLWKVRDGVRLYTSEFLEDKWELGFCTVGDVTFESAAYTARYVMKKLTGPAEADGAYKYVNVLNGEEYDLRPEYNNMSRGSAIGSKWYERYKAQTQFDDRVVMRGVPMQPPKAYDRIFELEDPRLYAATKRRRKSKAKKHAADNTTERLRVREKVKEAQAALLIRGLENEA